MNRVLPSMALELTAWRPVEPAPWRVLVERGCLFRRGAQLHTIPPARLLEPENASRRGLLACS